MNLPGIQEFTAAELPVLTALCYPKPFLGNMWSHGRYLNIRKRGKELRLSAYRYRLRRIARVSRWLNGDLTIVKAADLRRMTLPLTSIPFLVRFQVSGNVQFDCSTIARSSESNELHSTDYQKVLLQEYYEILGDNARVTEKETDSRIDRNMKINCENQDLISSGISRQNIMVGRWQCKVCEGVTFVDQEMCVYCALHKWEVSLGKNKGREKEKGIGSEEGVDENGDGDGEWWRSVQSSDEEEEEEEGSGSKGSNDKSGNGGDNGNSKNKNKNNINDDNYNSDGSINHDKNNQANNCAAMENISNLQSDNNTNSDGIKDNKSKDRSASTNTTVNKIEMTRDCNSNENTSNKNEDYGTVEKSCAILSDNTNKVVGSNSNSNSNDERDKDKNDERDKNKNDEENVKTNSDDLEVTIGITNDLSNPLSTPYNELHSKQSTKNSSVEKPRKKLKENEKSVKSNTFSNASDNLKRLAFISMKGNWCHSITNSDINHQRIFYLSLSLSLSLSVCLSVSLSVSLSLCLCLSLTLSLTHTHTLFISASLFSFSFTLHRPILSTLCYPLFFSFFLFNFYQLSSSSRFFLNLLFHLLFSFPSPSSFHFQFLFFLFLLAPISIRSDGTFFKDYRCNLIEALNKTNSALHFISRMLT